MPIHKHLLAILALVCLVDDLSAENITPRIAYFGTLKSGLAEAERSGRPLLLVSGAPHCLGVPGVW